MRLTVLNVAYALAPVGPAGVGGAERIVGVLDAGLVARGHHSIVVAAEGSRVRGTLVPSGSCDGRIDGRRLADAQQRHARAIAYALSQWPVDVVHFHGFDFHTYVPDTAVPLMATLHLPLAWYPPDALRAATRRVYCYCVSASQAERGAQLAGPLPVIENGVASVELSPGVREPFVLALGRICPEKGFHEALEAARLADIDMVLAGRTFGFDDHERYFREEIQPRIDDRRRYIGPIGPARKRQLLRRARCVAVPSRVAETSSLVAMEALSAGTPVVAFPSGALPDIVEHARTGFLVHDAAGMADAIRGIGAIDSRACVESARERFSLERMIDRYVLAYSRAVLLRRSACA